MERRRYRFGSQAQYTLLAAGIVFFATAVYGLYNPNFGLQRGFSLSLLFGLVEWQATASSVFALLSLASVAVSVGFRLKLKGSQIDLELPNQTSVQAQAGAVFEATEAIIDGEHEGSTAEALAAGPRTHAEAS